MVTLLAHVDAIRARDPLAQMGGLALDFVSKMVASPLAMFLVLKGDANYVLATVKMDPILGSDPDSLAREYMKCVAEGPDPILDCARGHSLANLIDTNQLEAIEGFDSSCLNEAFFAEYGLGPVLALSLWDEASSQRCILLLARSSAESEFSDREKSFLRQIAPLLTQSYHCAVGIGGMAAPAPSSVASELTPRELEIAYMAAHGARNWEIAEKLNIASGTVKCHMHNVYAKLGIDSRVHLALALGISY